MTAVEASTGYSLEDGPLKPGVRAGSYLIERRLGSGGMGAVYAATHVGLDKPVALKALHRTFAVQENSVKRFVREGRAASRIRHPHVVDVTDVGTHEGIPFLVMEMLDGEDLEQHLKRCGPLDVERLAQIMVPVIDAVASAHDAGVVHRDLKPSNIFLAQNSRGQEVAKVLDFGIARMLDEQGTDRIRLTQQGAFVGTPYYASPEQATNGSSADARSDQYSIGAILYQLASGELPVKGRTPFEVLTAIVCGEVIAFGTLRDTWNPLLVQVVERAMQFDANQRYADLRELGRALLAIADDETYSRFRGAFGAPLRDRDPSGFAPASLAVPASAAVPVQANMRAVQPVADQAGTSPMRSDLHSVPAGVVPGTRRAMPRVEGPAPSFSSPQAASRTPSDTPRSARGAALLVALAAVALSVAGASAYWVYGNAEPATIAPTQTPPSAEPVRLSVTPSGAVIELDGEPVGTGSASLPTDSETHRLRVSAPGFATVERDIGPGQTAPASLALIAEPAEDDVTPAAAETAEGADDEPSGETAAAPAPQPAVEEPARPASTRRSAGRRALRNRFARPAQPRIRPAGPRVQPRVRTPVRPVTRQVGANRSPVLP